MGTVLWHVPRPQDLPDTSLVAFSASLFYLLLLGIISQINYLQVVVSGSNSLQCRK